MSNSAQLELVEKALGSGLGGCIEWHGNEGDRIRKEMCAFGLTPEAIKRLTVEHVKNGGAVLQVKEERPNWKSRREYWYKVIIPIPDLFRKGLFVEIELFDDDPVLPEVRLVNAHEQT